MSDDAPDLVTAYFDYQRTHEDALAWASEAVDVSGFHEPQRKLEQLLVLLAAAPDDWQVGLLAAGPLEDLMRYHGDAVIDDVATEARQNLRLRQALAGIWLEPGPIAERVVAILTAP
jgi:hypothetical protein